MACEQHAKVQNLILPNLGLVFETLHVKRDETFKTERAMFFLEMKRKGEKLNRHHVAAVHIGCNPATSQRLFGSWIIFFSSDHIEYLNAN
jgi:hypothetical protein